jgi:membrane protease YdiL (CAAX protease family)
MFEFLAAALGPQRPDALELPLSRLHDQSLLDVLLSIPVVKALTPVPVLVALTPLVIWFFGKWWKEIDKDARAEWSLTTSAPRKAARRYPGPVRPRGPSSTQRILRFWRPRKLADPPFDYRPAACMVIVALVLTLQEYYGGRETYEHLVKPWLRQLEASGHRFIALGRYEDLWGYAWWAGCRVVGYVVVPLPLWKLLFPRDNLRDMGLRVTGLAQHMWIYGICLTFVVPAMLLVARQPDFGSYYPFYKLSSRSIWDFAVWEAIYWLQFLALEMFFRGWILGALRRSMGASAIFAMVVPYCMIHYGKPYLEANGAIVAGIVLGSLAMRTRSIYLGFLVHITVAFSMDLLALFRRGALPTVLWPPG